jgi:DNA-binding FadR family transcriptional regulator
VREAIRVLEVLGLVHTQVGSGPSSGAIIVAVPGGGMSALMRLQVAATGFAVADVVETRLVLESHVVSHLAGGLSHSSLPREGAAAGPAAADSAAADPASPDLASPDPGLPGLSAATAILDAMDDGSLTEAEFLALDQRFHLALAEAAGNHVITATMAGLRSAVESYVTAGAHAVADWDATRTRLQREHRGVLAEIAAGDAEAATRAIRAHITGYYRQITPGPPGPR